MRSRPPLPPPNPPAPPSLQSSQTLVKDLKQFCMSSRPISAYDNVTNTTATN